MRGVEATFDDEDFDVRVRALGEQLGLPREETLERVFRSGFEAEEARLAAPRVAVDIEPGPFASERSVVFRGPERSYAFLVDALDVDEREFTMRVTVVGVCGDHAVVRFPRDPASGSRTIKLHRTWVRGWPHLPREPHG